MRRFHIERNSGGDSGGQFCRAFTGASEADALGFHAAVQGDFQLSGRSDIQSIHQAGHVLNQRGHRIGFDGVVQFDCRRQHLPQQRHSLIQQVTVVGVKRGLSDPCRQLCQRYTPDPQAIVDHWQGVHWPVARASSGHGGKS